MPYARKTRKYSRKTRYSNRSSAANASKIRSIVKRTLASSREKKHFEQQAIDQVISTTGTNFNMVPAVSQGTNTNQRIGNEIQWKSYHVRMILKGGVNMDSAQVFRVIWYTARQLATSMPTSVSITSFLDKEKFIIHSDKVHRIGSNITRGSSSDIAAPTGVGAFKILNFGRKFKKPASLHFDDSTGASLLTNHMKCYIVSSSASTSLSYSTAVDFVSTCYYTDP